MRRKNHSMGIVRNRNRKNMKKRRIKRPYWRRNCRTTSRERGRKSNKTWEPSSGGIGSRLKMARTKFSSTICPKSSISAGEISASGAPKKRSKSPKKMAMARFAPGPAKLTLAEPYFLSRKLYGFTGTGFAQPNKNGLEKRTKRRGTATDPMGSI